MKTTTIGIDDGHAAIKLAWLDDDKKIRVQAIPSKARSGAFGHTTHEGKTVGVYEAGESRFTVSDSVTEQEETRFVDYPVSDLNRALVQHALQVAGFGGSTLKAVTGLPPGSFYDPRAESGLNDRLIERKKKSLLETVNVRAGTPAKIKQHHVFAEAVAVVYDYSINEAGEDAAAINGPLGIVDIGGRTTDVVVVIPGERGGMTIDQSRTASHNSGVLDLEDLIRSSLRNQFELDDIGAFDLRDALKTGKLSLFGQSQDVSKIIAECKNEQANKLHSVIQQKLGRGAALSKVIFCGGGAHSLSQLVKAFPKNGIVAPEPQFANARGFLKAGLYLIGAD